MSVRLQKYSQHGKRKAPKTKALVTLFPELDGEKFRQMDHRERFLTAFELTCGNVTASASAAGITRQTYYLWMRSPKPEDVEFRRRLDEARAGERLLDLAELVVVNALANGSLEAAKLVLTGPKGRNRGWAEGESADTEVLAAIRRRVEKTAAQMGTDFATELREFLDHYADTLRPDLREALVSELPN